MLHSFCLICTISFSSGYKLASLQIEVMTKTACVWFFLLEGVCRCRINQMPLSEADIVVKHTWSKKKVENVSRSGRSFSPDLRYRWCHREKIGCYATISTIFKNFVDEIREINGTKLPSCEYIYDQYVLGVLHLKNDMNSYRHNMSSYWSKDTDATVHDPALHAASLRALQKGTNVISGEGFKGRRCEKHNRQTRHRSPGKVNVVDQIRARTTWTTTKGSQTIVSTAWSFAPSTQLQ